MRQEAHGNKDLSSMLPWVRDVAREWRFLFDHANLTKVSTLEQFNAHVMRSEAFHIVVFTDGLHCRCNSFPRFLCLSYCSSAALPTAD
jgi:hypothetical protein